MQNHSDNETPTQIIYNITNMSKINKTMKISMKIWINQAYFSTTNTYQDQKGVNHSKTVPKSSKSWQNHGKKAKQLAFTLGLNKLWDPSKMMIGGDDRWWKWWWFQVCEHLFTKANDNPIWLLLRTVTKELMPLFLGVPWPSYAYAQTGRQAIR